MVETVYYDVPNLDCETCHFLNTFAANVERDPISVAQSIWRQTDWDHRNAARMLGRYASLKTKAIVLRECGKIREALAHETECDNIYRELPEFARW